MPWALGTVFGLAARVLETNPLFPTYPGPFTKAQVQAGFVEPYTLYAVAGRGGAAGLLLCIFMSVTSTVSSSMIAVSSIISFDFYHTYINRKATDKQVIRVSHAGVIFYGIFITGIALAMNYGGANMNWVQYCSPVLTSGGIFPLFFTLMWSGQTRLAAVIAPILGLASGIAVWLSSAYALYGSVSMSTTVQLVPAVYGSMTSFCSPIIYSIVISYIRPNKYDWREFLRVESLVQDSDDSSSGESDGSENGPATTIESVSPPKKDEEESVEKPPELVSTQNVVAKQSTNADDQIQSLDDVEHPFDAQTLSYLYKWYKIAWGFFIFIMLITWVVWSMPLYRDYVFGKAFYSGWVTVSIIWQFFAFFAVVVYPIYDGWPQLSAVFVGVIWSRLGRKNRP